MEHSNYDEIISIAKILKSKTSLLILNYLTKKDASNQELYDNLKNKVDISYRSSIFEVLKRIKKAGLVEKYYDDENNQIKYRLKYRHFSFDLETMSLMKE